eukprot:984263_1
MCFLNIAIDGRSDIEEIRCCAFALANAAAHEPNHRHLAQTGVLLTKTIVDFVRLNDADLNLSCSLLFSNIASSLGGHHMFGYADILETMIVLARSKDDETALNAMKALYNVALFGKHADVFLQTNACEFVGEFCRQRGDRPITDFSTQLLRYLALFACGLSKDAAMVIQMDRHNLASPLLDLLMIDDKETRQAAARALSRFAENGSAQHALLARDKLATFLTCLKLEDGEIDHLAALACGFVFDMDEVTSGHSVPGVAAMKVLLDSPRLDLQLAATWGLARGCMHSGDLLGRLAELAVSVSIPDPAHFGEGLLLRPEDRKKEEFREEFEKADAIRRYALGAITTHASLLTNHGDILEKCRPLLRKCFDLGDCDDVRIQRFSALLLSNMSPNPETHTPLTRAGDITRLDAYVAARDAQTQLYAVAALRGFVQSEAVAQKVVKSERLIPLLCLTALNSPPSVNLHIAALFLNLTCHAKLTPLLLEQHIMPGVCHLLHSDDPLVQLSAVRAVENLVQLPAGMSAMLDHSMGGGGIWKLVGVRSKDIRASAVSVLARISLLPEEKQYLLGQDDDVSNTMSLLDVAQRFGGPIEHCAAVVIRRMASYPEWRSKMVHCGAVPVVLKMCQSELTQVKELATSALGYLLQCLEGTHACVNIQKAATRQYEDAAMDQLQAKMFGVQNESEERRADGDETMFFGGEVIVNGEDPEDVAVGRKATTNGTAASAANELRSSVGVKKMAPAAIDVCQVMRDLLKVESIPIRTLAMGCILHLIEEPVLFDAFFPVAPSAPAHLNPEHASAYAPPPPDKADG